MLIPDLMQELDDALTCLQVKAQAVEDRLCNLPTFTANISKVKQVATCQRGLQRIAPPLM
ncbi:MAG: hypothetical protein CML22_06875 [Rheinheimera sp.]|nr:hypothetical protein [Rheinheimera sp.]MBM34006.1 hypothetical protein [Rheinheimera sp.]